ncbi:COG4223 family protein [Yoonia sp. MH D7]
MAKQPAKGGKPHAKSKVQAPKNMDVTPELDTVEGSVPTAEHEEPKVTPRSESEVVDTTTVEEPVVEVRSETSIPPVKEPEKKKVSVIPAIFGGLVAGAIGFGAAYLVLPQPDMLLPDRVSAQGAEIAGLRDRLDTLPTVDLSGVEGAQAETVNAVQALDDRITGLETTFADLRSRAGDAGSLANATYAQELDALRSEMEDLRGTAVAELSAARDAAASIEANAEKAALAAAGRAALSRIDGGLETGAPLGAALDDLSAAIGGDVPSELTAVRDGVPTLASLQASFPDYARAALATARREGAAGEVEGGFTAFLRDQLDVRSVAPKDGDGADAVLSRAEAALRQGRLTDTLAEVSALPEVARAELIEWQGLAEARADALAAAATLATSLNDN